MIARKRLRIDFHCRGRDDCPCALIVNFVCNDEATNASLRIPSNSLAMLFVYNKLLRLLGAKR